MAEQTKQYPPSDLKLSRLRHEGVVPFSKDTLLIGAFGGLIAAVILLGHFWAKDYLTLIRTSLSTFAVEPNSPRELNALFAENFAMLGRALSLVVGAVVSGVIAVGLLQTRFLLTSGAFRFSFRGGRASRMAGVIGFAKAFTLLVVAILVLRYLTAEYFTGYFGNSEQGVADVVLHSMSWIQPILVYYSLSLFALVVFVGIVSRFVVVLQFREAFGMTREEVMAEVRESEASPEIRQALKDNFK